jgi:hypothetical protein
VCVCVCVFLSLLCLCVCVCVCVWTIILTPFPFIAAGTAWTTPWDLCVREIPACWKSSGNGKRNCWISIAYVSRGCRPIYLSWKSHPLQPMQCSFARSWCRGVWRMPTPFQANLLTPTVITIPHLPNECVLISWCTFPSKSRKNLALLHLANRPADPLSYMQLNFDIKVVERLFIRKAVWHGQ